MLSAEEKCYCRALEALRNKQYSSADKELKNCSELITEASGLRIIAEAVKLMVAIKTEQGKQIETKSRIKEIISDGEKAIVFGQSQQKEVCQSLPDLPD